MNERAKIVTEIGKIKEDNSGPVYVPSREKMVLERIAHYNTGPLPSSVIGAVYREIISGCRALERPLTVCFLGPSGTFSELASIQKFGSSTNFLMAGTLSEIFDFVERRRADYGVVPVENSTQGGIHETLSCFLESPLKVCAEITLRIQMSLLGRCPLSEVKRIYSKRVAFEQCRQWIQKNVPWAELEETDSTAAAADLAEREEGAAAVGRRELAADHELDVLCESIEDYAHNFTRFFVISDHIGEPTGADKTALLCAVKHKVGALHDLLRPFKEYAINVTKIESFPSPREAFRYYFFIDFQGHLEQQHVKETLANVEKECVDFRVLGAFPAG